MFIKETHRFFTGLVVSNELTNTNVLIMDVFTLLFQVASKKSLKHNSNLDDRLTR